jgi:hypothetical protein
MSLRYNRVTPSRPVRSSELTGPQIRVPAISVSDTEVVYRFSVNVSVFQNFFLTLQPLFTASRREVGGETSIYRVTLVLDCPEISENDEDFAYQTDIK